MDRHEFLSGVHSAFSPRNYLEIGVSDGRSLTLSRTRSIGIDPAFKVMAEQECALKLVRATSDDFFARPAPVDFFPEGTIDYALIDGMHLFEYALRDFMNVERHSTWSTVIVFDDMLPRSVSEAARDRHTVFWAGDVYKVTEVLRRYRPDLVLVELDTEPTGLLLVLGADPTNNVLHEKYDEIIAEFVYDDPQRVGTDFLERKLSADPAAVLATDVWGKLAAARDAGSDRDASLFEPIGQLIGSGPVKPVVPPGPNPWPIPKAAKKAASPKSAPQSSAPKKPAEPSVRRAARDLKRAVQRSAKRRLGRS